MPSFWDTYETEPPRRPRKDATPTAQNRLVGVCEFCGFVGDDVLLGVCADCAPKE